MVVNNRIKITKAFLSQLRPTGKRTQYYDSTVHGLLLRASPDSTSRVWYLDYMNRQQKRCRYRIGTVKQFAPEEAKIEARKLLADIADGMDPSLNRRAAKIERIKSEKRTLRKFLESDYWEKHLKYAPTGVATKMRIKSAWNGILDDDMETLSNQKVTIIRNKRQNKGIKPGTLNRDRVALIALLNKAVEWDILKDNPISRWKPLKVEEVNRVRYLEEKERKRFHAVLAKSPDYLRAMVLLAMHTGMRRGEIFSLTWDDVDFNQCQIKLKAGNTKTRKGRIVYLNSTASQVLRDWRGSKKFRSIKGWVFINLETGKPFTDIKKSWAGFCKRAKITDFRFHDLRHDFCSQLVMAGIPLATVKELAGHATIEMTERYSHLAPSHLTRAIEVLK